MKISSALLFVAVVQATAQTPQVPHKMQFADLTLVIRDDARKEIQQDVDALTRSPKHHAIKVERAKTYFPIIEEIFREENVPDDFKYLVLQESALIADAVSVSDAVGFWQFKDFTAIEMGMRIDKHIDERMNIVSSTRAAARYLKKNNSIFNNWLYALQSYQMGAGGVMRSVKDTQSGARRMEITSDTYWYVKKFLAHKIAFEQAVGGKGEIQLVALTNASGRSLKELAREAGVDVDELRSYNKWIKSGDVPTDRTYAVVVPVVSKQMNLSAGALADDEPRRPGRVVIERPVMKRINGVPAIQALEGESVQELAKRAGVEPSDLLKWNDMRTGLPTDRLSAGAFYFISRKRLRATEDFHKLMPGEDLWTVSQRYGVKLKRLKRYNRLDDGAKVEAGMMLYLASRRPRTTSVQEIEDAVIVDRGETFNWSAVPDAPRASETISAPAENITARVADTAGVTEHELEKNAESLTEEQPDATGVETATQISQANQLATAQQHAVRAGETLYSISRMYGVTVMQLAEWNNLDVQNGLRIGQVLNVSEEQSIEGESVPPAADGIGEVIHEVKPADTLYSIARHYGVTIKELMDWNGKTDFALAVGEKLKIRQPR